jgi:hypothetical protein
VCKRSVLFLKQVPDLGAVRLLARCRWRSFFLLHLAYLANEQKDDEINDQELDDGIDEYLIGDYRNTCRSRCREITEATFLREIEKHIGKSPRGQVPIRVGGIITSFTSEETIFPKATPMMKATASSITLPRAMNALNSSTNHISDPSFKHNIFFTLGNYTYFLAKDALFRLP